MFQEYKTKKLCKSVRREFLFWGYDLSKMTDEELIASVNRVSIKIANMGITTKQAINGLSLLFKEA